MAHLCPASWLRPASLSDLTPLSLLFPTTSYDYRFLVCGTPDAPIAVYLTDDFLSFPAINSDGHVGLAIEDVLIEIDIESAFRSNGYSDPWGCLVRESDQLSIATKLDGGSFGASKKQILMSGMNLGTEGRAIAFSKWQVVKYREKERIVLVEFNIDVPQNFKV